MLYVNIFWGLVNLLPVYPLDGGQIARELLELASPADGVRQSLWLSVIAAVGGGGPGIHAAGRAVHGDILRLPGLHQLHDAAGYFGPGAAGRYR